MATFVLDASVAVSWCFPGDPTEDTPYSRRVLKELVANDAIVPEIWAFEIANSIFVSFSKRGRISEQYAQKHNWCKTNPGARGEDPERQGRRAHERVVFGTGRGILRGH
jgi:hypothetical protein